MAPDIALLVAVLMKNEDVWLKMPSEEVYQQLVEMFNLMGVNISCSDGYKIRINSPEMIIKNRENAKKLEVELQLLNKKRTIFERPEAVRKIRDMAANDLTSIGQLAVISEMEETPPPKKSFFGKLFR